METKTGDDLKWMAKLGEARVVMEFRSAAYRTEVVGYELLDGSEWRVTVVDGREMVVQTSGPIVRQ